jgi:hypothetical protein
MKKGHDAASQQIVDDVQNFGWTVVGFEPDENGTGYSYSVGMHQTLGHPEILVLGLHGQHAAQLINAIGDEIKAGRSFRDGETVENLFSGFPMAFRKVADEYSYLADKVQWFYETADVGLLQCFWPDPNRLFPWEQDCESECQQVQRIDSLYHPGGLTGDEQLDALLSAGLVEPVLLMPWAGPNALNVVYLPPAAAAAKQEIDARVLECVTDGDEVNYTAKPEYDDDGKVPARIVINAKGKTISINETIEIKKPTKED